MPSNRTPTTAAVLAIAAALLLAGATPLAAAIPAGDGGDDATATFASETFADHRGDVVRLAVDLDGTTGATVRLGDGGSVATVSVVDENGDGRVAVLVNTYLVGRDTDRAFAAAGADTAVVRNATASGALAAGTYDLTVTAGTEQAAVDDEATLRLREPAVRDLQVGVAEVDERANLTSPAEIRAAMGTDRLHDRNYLVDRGLAVLELEAGGLSGALAAQDGPNETARFFSLLERPDVTLAVDHDPRTISIHESPTTLDVTSHGATDVVADPGNDTYYLLVDVDAAVVLEPESKHMEEFEPEDRVNLTVTVAADSNLTDGRETATASVARTEWRADIDDSGRSGELVVAPGPGEVLAGETNVPPGYPVTVAVTDRTDGAVVRSKNVTVGSDGRFAARFDLGELRDETPLLVEVRFRGRTLESRQGRAEATDADVAVRDLRWEDSLAVVVDATLDDGGFVVVHADSPDGPVLGHSEPLAGSDSPSPETHENVTVSLEEPVDAGTDLFVVLHHDGPTVGELDFGDEPYFSNGSTVATAVEVPATDASTRTASPTPSSSTAPPTTGTSPSSPTQSAATTTTSPGFGVALAGFALAVVAFLGVGHRRTLLVGGDLLLAALLVAAI